MAKKKNTQHSSAQVKPEAYIRSRARRLPVFKCYKSINTYEDREMSIVVIRQHPKGTFTLAAFMLDRWCLGVKDTLWKFNIEEDELDFFLSLFEENLDTLDEIEYVEAHNWVYGALAFAEDAGIKPCKGFDLTQHLLAEDDDNVELMEFDFGRNGKHCLVAKNHKEAARYIPLLDSNLGQNNYTVEIGPFGDDWDEDEDDDGMSSTMETEFPLKVTPTMEYSYQGGCYPKEIVLHHPEIEAIVSKATEDISDDDIETVLTLPADGVREDLHNLILRELGRQWGRSAAELGVDDDSNWCVVGNACMLLTPIATVDGTLPVILEVMRQSPAFLEYNFADSTDVFLNPVLYMLVKDNPLLMKSYLLEPGLTYYFKLATLELLEDIAKSSSKMRPVIVGMAVELLQKYEADLAERSICDGAVVAFAIGILVGTGSVDYLPLIEEIYATGLVDESCKGSINVVRREIRNPHWGFMLPDTDLYTLRDRYKRFIEQ